MDTKRTVPLTASSTFPKTVNMSVLYHSAFKKYIKGILPSSNTIMVIYSFIGSNSSKSSSADTPRISLSFDTIGGRMDFKL